MRILLVINSNLGCISHHFCDHLPGEHVKVTKFQSCQGKLEKGLMKV